MDTKEPVRVGSRRVFANRVESFLDFAKRFRRVEVEQLDFETLFKKYDPPNTLFYCDPPYENACQDYATQWTTDDSRRLVASLLTLQGRVVLSCYDNDVYSPLGNSGWERTHYDAISSVSRTKADGKRRRVETVYVSPKK